MTAVEYIEAIIYGDKEFSLSEAFEQAKEMEKQQIELAHIDGGKNKRTSVNYYNETFKSE